MKPSLRFLSLALGLTLEAAGAYSQTRVTAVRYNQDIDCDLAVGLWGVPLPYDYDGDGLKDLVVSAPDLPYRGLYFFRNIGTQRRPFFDRAVKLSTIGENNIRFSESGGEAFVLSPGREWSGFFSNLYERPEIIEYEGERIGGTFKNSRSDLWNYVDWDGDGDKDIIVGVDTWDDYGWDNAFDSTGRWTNGPLHGYVYLIENVDGHYINRGKISAGGVPMETYGSPAPCIADFDGDGDLDIICGEFLDGLTWFENVGSRERPEFAGGVRLSNRKGEIRLHLQMIMPVVSDFDGDGHPDLIVGDEDGRVAWLRNTGKSRHGIPRFDNPYYFRQKADLVKFGALVTPFSVDWDGDGDEDIVAGNSAGEIAVIENLSGGGNPVWNEPRLIRVGRKPFRIMAGENGSIQGPAERKWGYTVLSVADLDGDGFKDIIFNSITGQIQWLKNKGSKSGLDFSGPKPVYVEWSVRTPKPVWNWWSPEPGTLVTQWRTSPAILDWNGDGLEDLIMMDAEGYLSYFERIPSSDGEVHLKPGARIFSGTNCCEYNGWRVCDSAPGPLRLNPDKAGQSGRRKICFADWDGDGRLDLIVNSTSAAWFRNVADKDGVTWFEYKGNICTAQLAGHSTCPTPVDWNADGRTDILLGAEDGHLYLVSNNL